ncbi:MAG: hypothetical protein JXP37_10810 [Coriobacteriia bacterium]|nr:hypothetical protein [Coriobacteriia bacterium]
MSITRSTRRSVARIGTMVVALVLTATLAGCGAGTQEPRDVADSTSLFHFKIPAEWQYRIESSLITVYAAEELPAEGEAPEALTIVTYVSNTTTETPVPEALADYVAFYGDQRSWTDVEVTEPTEIVVGDRTAWRVDISGTDGSSRPFRAAYVWIRTNDREVLVTGVTPQDTWDAYEDDFEDVLAEWYWHRPEGAPADVETTE